MKTLRLIGYAVVAILMCVNLSSCGGDDDEEQEGSVVVTDSKVLVKLEIKYYQKNGEYHGDGDIYTFTRDKNKRLVYAVFTHRESWGDDNLDESVWNYSYKWGDDVIESTCTNAYESSISTLANGKVMIQQLESEKYSWSYNENGRLACMIQELGGSSYYYDAKWDGDKIIEYGNKKISYSGKTCKGNFLPCLILENLLSLAHPNLFGVETNQLPDKIGDETISDYTFTKDGYVESCRVYYDDGFNCEYKLTWE
jgi:hypothetical protein